MPIPVAGTPAPDFTLASTAGTDVTLSTLRGKKVLLAFFPAAFTKTCTAELCGFTDEFAEFEKTGTVVLPISVDAVPSLKAYKAQERIGVELLSDFRREVSRTYGVLNEAKFSAQRAYVVIDGEGKVRWTHVEEHGGFKRENSELLGQLRALG